MPKPPDMRLAWELDSPASAAPIICSCVALNNIAARSNRRQNGGSACGYQELSAPLAIPATAEHSGGQAVCLCITSVGRECAHLPHTARQTRS
jgi:hypothetical protein